MATKTTTKSKSKKSRAKAAPTKPAKTAIKKTTPPATKKTQHRGWRLLKGIVKFVLVWLAPFLALESSFFSELLSKYNYLETFPSEMVLPTLMHGLTALIIAIVVTLVSLKKPLNIAARLTSASLLGLLMINYDNRLMAILQPLRAVVPLLPQPEDDIPIISLIFIIILVILAIGLGRLLQRAQSKYPQLQTTNLVIGIFIFLSFLFGGQALRLGHIVPQMIEQSHVQPAALAKSAGQRTKPTPSSQLFKPPKPDIYYIVLDRYANQTVLKDQFNYDNHQFTDYLAKQNFTVNANAFSHYPYTALSVSSTINGSYTNDIVAPYKNSDVQSRTLYHNLIYQSSVIQAVKAAGYQYYNVGSWYGASNRAPLADRDDMWDHQISWNNNHRKLHGLESTQVGQSPYYRFGKVSSKTASWWPFKIEDRDQVDDVKQQLSALHDITTQGPAGGRFIFAHILVPHDPFVFNADGSLASDSGSDSTGKNVKQKYLGQVQFINSRMQEIVNNIQKQSGGQAVIILNSDEGPYPRTMNDVFSREETGEASDETGVIVGDMRQWPDSWLRMKYGILQAVHIPAATPEDLAQVSSVNVFRVVLNRYFGYNLDYLPSCHYALSVGSQSEFQYGDITNKLETTADPKCAAYQSLP